MLKLADPFLPLSTHIKEGKGRTPDYVWGNDICINICFHKAKGIVNPSQILYKISSHNNLIILYL